MNADPRRRELVIRTPEGIAFAFELAGPVLRGAAFIIDLFIVAAATQLVDAVMALFRLLSQDVFGAVATLKYERVYPATINHERESAVARWAFDHRQAAG